ncbi:hypothetical protein SDJN03_29264, partial [Cucurbita argyrosperma subsp. sororia]
MRVGYSAGFLETFRASGLVWVPRGAGASVYFGPKLQLKSSGTAYRTPDGRRRVLSEAIPRELGYVRQFFIVRSVLKKIVVQVIGKEYECRG